MAQVDMADLDYRESEQYTPEREPLGNHWGTPLEEAYLWYAIGDSTRLSEEEVSTLVARHFVEGYANRGDIELKGSDLPGFPTVLRLRGRLYLFPTVILGDRECPLYHVGRPKRRTSLFTATRECLEIYYRMTLGIAA